MTFLPIGFDGMTFLPIGVSVGLFAAILIN